MESPILPEEAVSVMLLLKISAIASYVILFFIAVIVFFFWCCRFSLGTSWKPVSPLKGAALNNHRDCLYEQGGHGLTQILMEVCVQFRESDDIQESISTEPALQT